MMTVQWTSAGNCELKLVLYSNGLEYTQSINFNHLDTIGTQTGAKTPFRELEIVFIWVYTHGIFNFQIYMTYDILRESISMNARISDV